MDSHNRIECIIKIIAIECLDNVLKLFFERDFVSRRRLKGISPLLKCNMGMVHTVHTYVDGKLRMYDIIQSCDVRKL
jgi:hypothetical protein